MIDALLFGALPDWVWVAAVIALPVVVVAGGAIAAWRAPALDDDERPIAVEPPADWNWPAR
jgi:hypothetical protein